MDTPEPPREGRAASLGRAAEARGLVAARWAGRGDEKRGLSMLSLVAAAASFVCLFLPWLGSGGNRGSGWTVPLARDYGLVALAAVLVELLLLTRAWSSRGSALVAFCLVAGAGVLGVSAVADLRWGEVIRSGFSLFQYGAWLGLVFALILIVLATLRLTALTRAGP